MNPLPPPPPDSGGGPPPPFIGSPQQPYGAPPQPQPYNVGYPPGQFGANTFAQPRPRPKAPVGAALLIVGAAVTILAVYLPWYEGNGITLKGMDTFDQKLGLSSFEKPGVAYWVVGVIVLGLGIAALLVGRQLALAIVTVVMTTLGGLFTLVALGVVENEKDFGELVLDERGSSGIGVILGPVGMVVALAGAIIVLVKRRQQV